MLNIHCIAPLDVMLVCTGLLFSHHHRHPEKSCVETLSHCSLPHGSAWCSIFIAYFCRTYCSSVPGSCSCHPESPVWGPFSPALYMGLLPVAQFSLHCSAGHAAPLRRAPVFRHPESLVWRPLSELQVSTTKRMQPWTPGVHQLLILSMTLIRASGEHNLKKF